MGSHVFVLLKVVEEFQRGLIHRHGRSYRAPSGSEEARKQMANNKCIHLLAWTCALRCRIRADPVFSIPLAAPLLSGI